MKKYLYALLILSILIWLSSCSQTTILVDSKKTDTLGEHHE